MERDRLQIVYNPQNRKPWGVKGIFGEIRYFATEKEAHAASIIRKVKRPQDESQKEDNRPIYDKNLLEKIAKDMGLTKDPQQ